MRLRTLLSNLESRMLLGRKALSCRESERVSRLFAFLLWQCGARTTAREREKRLDWRRHTKLSNTFSLMCEFLFFHAGLSSARNWLLGASSRSLQQPSIDPPAPLHAPQTRTRSLFAPNEKKISLVIYLKVRPLALGGLPTPINIFKRHKMYVFALLQIGAANYPQLIGFDTSHFCANIKRISVNLPHTFLPAIFMLIARRR